MTSVIIEDNAKVSLATSYDIASNSNAMNTYLQNLPKRF